MDAQEGIRHSDPDGRLYLRPLVEADFTERYVAWFRDPEFTKYLDARDISREDAIRHLHDGQDGKHWKLYAICEKDGDRHIGNLKIGPIRWRDRVSDFVTVLGERDSWGKGYAREAVRIGIDIAFKELNLRKLSASMDSRNIGSVKAYCAAGFALESSLKDQYMDTSPEGVVLADKVFVACFNPAFDPKLPPPFL